MFIGTVVGNIVAPTKTESLLGKKFLIVQPILPVGTDNFLIAVDTVGAGFGETVLVVIGSAARQLPETKALPIDAAIIGIVGDMKIQEKGD